MKTNMKINIGLSCEKVLQCLFDFGQSHSSPLCVLKQGSDQILHLQAGKLQRQWTFTIGPPVGGTESHINQPITRINGKDSSFDAAGMFIIVDCRAWMKELYTILCGRVSLRITQSGHFSQIYFNYFNMHNAS